MFTLFRARAPGERTPWTPYRYESSWPFDEQEVNSTHTVIQIRALPFLECDLCPAEQHLVLPRRHDCLMVLHTVIGHEWPIERVQQASHLVLRSGEAV